MGKNPGYSNGVCKCLRAVWLSQYDHFSNFFYQHSYPCMAMHYITKTIARFTRYLFIELSSNKLLIEQYMVNIGQAKNTKYPDLPFLSTF